MNELIFIFVKKKQDEKAIPLLVGGIYCRPGF
jgi:hypothetical protein